MSAWAAPSTAERVGALWTLLSLAGCSSTSLLSVPLPYCARCRASVSSLHREVRIGSGEFVFAARCHGEVEVSRVTFDEVELGLIGAPVSLRVVLRLAVAFLAEVRPGPPSRLVAELARLGARLVARRPPPALPPARCECCETTEGVSRVPSMTAYERAPTEWEAGLHRREVRRWSRAQEVARALAGEGAYFSLPDHLLFSVPDEVANRDVLLCGGCAEGHVAYWEERWAEYWGSR